MTQNYAVKSVPLVVVDGKYKTSAPMAQGHDNVFKVVDQIINTIVIKK